MKKQLTVVIVACLVMTLLSSCNTLSSALTHGKSSVFMMRAPKDLEVTCNGKPLEKVRDKFAGKITARMTNGYVCTKLLLPVITLRL